MGPYYRGTSQGMGNFFGMFYEHPALIFIAVAAVVAVFIWRRKKSHG